MRAPQASRSRSETFAVMRSSQVKGISVALTTLSILGCTSTVDRSNHPHVQITWAGTYTGNRVTSEVSANGVLSHQLSTVFLIKSTTRIPARQGIRFGVQYRVTGIPNSTVAKLRRVLRYPAPGALIPSARSPLTYDEVEVECVSGGDCITGYGLDQPWEVIPGKWTFEFWSGDRLLAQQSFTVLTAGGADSPTPLL